MFFSVRNHPTNPLGISYVNFLRQQLLQDSLLYKILNNTDFTTLVGKLTSYHHILMNMTFIK